MDPLTTAAASGMRGRMEALEMLAHNLANANTPGFKADRELYSDYVAADLEANNNSKLPDIQSRWTDFAQGVLTATGNPLDLALSGRGFFVVNGPEGPLYTRDGSFQIARNGQLVTRDGYAVRQRDGKPVVLDPQQTVEVDREGAIRQAGNVVAQLDLVEFPAPQALTKRAGNYFAWSDPNRPAGGTPPEVAQGHLESANVSPAEASVQLINVMRQFEMLTKALQIGGEMSKRVLDDVARI
jgi:flagellar basal-body rod protein FlgF